MSGCFVALGEIIMRLKPQGKLRLRQAGHFEICIGGAEANVATALSQFGDDVRFVSALPHNEIGVRAIKDLKANGVDTRFIERNDARLGLYFLEEGADYRSGCVVYDRDGTAFTKIRPDELDWDAIFEGVDWFHISGITPAISPSTRLLAEISVAQAKSRNIHISIDLNYRERLWNYSVDPVEVLPNLVAQCDTLIAGRGDCPNCLHIDGDGENGSDEWAISLASKLKLKFENLSHIALTIRSSSSADRHNWRGMIQGNNTRAFSRTYSLKNVVDRVGTGDAFCAGLIYKLRQGADLETALNFGAATTCLKHSIHGDFNAVSEDDVQSLVESTDFGRLKR
jgi:2-dehydro-3-deoxygluconokinase